MRGKDRAIARIERIIVVNLRFDNLGIFILIGFILHPIYIDREYNRIIMSDSNESSPLKAIINNDWGISKNNNGTCIESINGLNTI